MKSTKELKQLAKDALRGKWKTAILTGLVAALFGATIFGGGGGYIKVFVENLTEEPNWVNYASESAAAYWLVQALLVAELWSLICLVANGAVKLGYACFQLRLLDGEEVRVSTVFSMIGYLWEGIVMNILRYVFVLLWSLLLVIPGILKALGYSMTPYVLAEHPELTVRQAMRKSEELMLGNKWALFYLGLTFIGWTALVALFPMLILFGATFLLETGLLGATGGIAVALVGLVVGEVLALILLPYMEATYAAFYRDLAPKNAVLDLQIMDGLTTEFDVGFAETE